MCCFKRRVVSWCVGPIEEQARYSARDILLTLEEEGPICSFWHGQEKGPPTSEHKAAISCSHGMWAFLKTFVSSDTYTPLLSPFCATVFFKFSFFRCSAQPV